MRFQCNKTNFPKFRFISSLPNLSLYLTPCKKFKFCHKTRCPLSSLLFNIILEFLTRAIRQEKKKPIWSKRKKKMLFADDIILYMGNQRLHQKILEIVNEVSKVKEYLINITRSMVFLYTNNHLLKIQRKQLHLKLHWRD